MALVSLKRSKKDMAEEQKEMAMPMDQEFPYGTCLHLDTDELDKLGVKELPTVGDEYNIRAVGKVTRVSSSASEGSDEQNGMDIQITMMELVHESEQEGESDSVAEEEAEGAESNAVGGKARTIMHTSYRGKR